MNVLDPKADGAMVVTYLPEGRPVWLDQIRDRFLHPTSESFASYANTILGEDGGDDLDDATNPAREEVIVLSSGGSDGSHEGLIPRSTRPGPPQGTGNEPVGDGADVSVDIVEQLETRKKKTLDKSEKKKKVEGSATEAPRKQPSTLPFLNYVVVSNTLSGLDARDKRVEHEPDDHATLTEIMKKRKTLDEKKKELDEQAVAALAAKKSKLQMETPSAPSESEID
ncbi:hypothetical protein HanXRQr2_Chr01g0035011 [Helianthus annuus]|uniref:Uncharacterized protein n=1 Tax=Helianthus annuus TaxID=4232 RepID=A0A9K3P3X9_HELAN|nr:hypothetical protein HanXRQr2_Chr01g0035011 [Helianthus annuus]KAJ0627883.1 hypothetical protein HanHA89_Chr01g0030741 [Helianthus annuus]